jgi:poly-gamma-glutamate synthesis protein (capsule biosynthesis protein)
LLAAGDACFGRLLGQEILKNPAFDPFESSARLFGAADIRFVNMESQLSDQKGETQSLTQKLVFTGPPGGADALARGHVDIVSAANNHMWDYGKSAFLQTLDNLDRAGVKYAGAGRSRERTYAPVIVESGGLRVAFLAFTGIWNQGDLRFHEAKDHVAEAGREAITQGVKAARARSDVDFVVVSYHGGEEYVSVPLQLAIDLHHAAIDAGADAVIGHHPHVAQGIEVYRGKPIFYSLGNYLMRTHGTHWETEIGFFARIAFSKGAEPQASVCPFRIAGLVPRPVLLADDPRRDLYERIFRQRLRVVQGSLVAPAYIGPTAEDGCASAETPKHRDSG